MHQIQTSTAQTTTDASRPPYTPLGDIIGIDIYEQDGYKYLLVVDYYSRFPIIKALPDTSADTVCKQYTQILTEYGLPTTIIADCGSHFMSERFKRECHNLNITLKTSSPSHQSTNGVAERTVGTMKALWRKAYVGGKKSAHTQHYGCTGLPQ